MGKFDGYLICSDFDGTIYIDQQISEKNIKAIEHFQSEGGYFTFASGRNYEIFATGIASVITPNAPILAYNGAFIVSIDGKDVYYQGEITKEQMLHAFTAYDLCEGIKCFHVNTTDCVKVYTFDEKDSPEARRAFVDSFDAPFVKMIAVMHDVHTDETYAEVKKIFSPYFNITRSWKFGIEFNNLADSKGRAARWLKERLGCHTLICVGDYDNDIDMVAAADIGYAVENATANLKAVADRITVHCRESAIAKIIEEISG
jgi:Cof subfamily protein (haloacid dehalogenase superfamily)